MAFEAITTQEQFDRVVNERLEEERGKYSGFLSPEDVQEKYKGFLSPEDVQEKYKGYLSPEDVQEKYKDYLDPEKAAEKDATIKQYESASKKVKIAMETGIPYELAEKISGETEEDMRKDAKTMAGFLKKGNPYPEYNPEPNDNKKTKEAAMKRMLNGLKGE